MVEPVLGITKLVQEDISLVEILVPLMLLGLVVIISFRALRERLQRLRGHYFRRNHVIIIGLSRIALQLAGQLLAQGRKVSLVSPGKLSSDAEMLRKRGAHVLASNENETGVLEKAGLPSARTCLIATGNDKDNLSTAELLRELKRTQGTKHQLRILVQVENINSLEAMKDYLQPTALQGNSELIPFNEKKLAAQQTYDLNPPFFSLNGTTRLQEEEYICVIGMNEIAELFLVENAILTQYPTDKRLHVLLIAENAEREMGRLFARRPYLPDYLEITPIELVNNHFSASKAWSKKLIDALPAIDAAYCFGDDDSLLFGQAMHFRQFLYTHTKQARRVPITVCLPEATTIAHLLVRPVTAGEKNASILDLGFHFMHAISDTCTVKNLIDERETNKQLAMAVNYFYSIRYEFSELLRTQFRQANAFSLLKDLENKVSAFRPKTNAPLAELEAMVIDALVAFTKNSAWRIRKHFGITERWNALTERKKDANRYVVRHMRNKLFYLHKKNVPLTPEGLQKEMNVLAPLEHKRWCAEKMVAGFTPGELPDDDKVLKALLKDVLKVSDQLIPFSKLDEINRKKDLDVFLILPLLVSIQERLTGTN